MRHTPATHRVPRPGPSRLLRLAGTLATLACVSVAGLGLSAASALAEDCPNAALRAGNDSTRLPECRAYEMVTPLYKEGFPAEPEAFTDQDVVAYKSIGSFAGNTSGKAGNRYHATRSADGWTTTPLSAPEDTYRREETVAQSADLRSSLWLMFRRDEPTENVVPTVFYLRGPDGAFTAIGNGALEGHSPTLVGVSSDLSHVIVSHGGSGSVNVSALYELTPGSQRPVNVDNTGALTSGETCPASTSADGRVIAFSSNCPIGSGPRALWARVGNSATVAVSGSECTRTSGDPGGACNPPAPATFAGTSTDGSRMYFTTTQQLVNSDTDQTNDLYECKIPPGTPAPVGSANPCASLSEISSAASGADVQYLVSASEDGSRVYFVAHGVLAANLGANDLQAIAGANNLYVWEKDAAHPAGQTTFIAGLENNGVGGKTTADGQYLVFSTAARLLASDTDEAQDIYRYDAETGALLRLSTDTDGSGGSEPGFEASLRGKAMTPDADTVIFETAEALSPADTDGVADVYEWHEGRVSLISKGGGTPLGITSSGKDIFFLTGQPLTAGDSGTEADIYDARLEGGFPVSAPAPCSAEACQGTLALQPQPPGTAASTAFNGPGSPLAGETPPANQAKPKPQTAAQKLAKALKACKSKHNKKKRAACEKKARKTNRRGK